MLAQGRPFTFHRVHAFFATTSGPSRHGNTPARNPGLTSVPEMNEMAARNPAIVANFGI
jgi:hypothetical protein